MIEKNQNKTNILTYENYLKNQVSVSVRDLCWAQTISVHVRWLMAAFCFHTGVRGLSTGGFWICHSTLCLSGALPHSTHKVPGGGPLAGQLALPGTAPGPTFVSGNDPQFLRTVCCPGILGETRWRTTSPSELQYF